jgi:hypothetical protein
MPGLAEKLASAKTPSTAETPATAGMKATAEKTTTPGRLVPCCGSGLK